jgi:hypothetical protein
MKQHSRGRVRAARIPRGGAARGHQNPQGTRLDCALISQRRPRGRRGLLHHEPGEGRAGAVGPGRLRRRRGPAVFCEQRHANACTGAGGSTT